MKITSNIGNNQKSKPEDIITIKKALNSIGLYSGDITMPFIDGEMESGIYAIQKSEELKTDGLITPDGETYKAIIRTVAKSPRQQCTQCGGWHGGVYGDVCSDCLSK